MSVLIKIVRFIASLFGGKRQSGKDASDVPDDHYPMF